MHFGPTQLILILVIVVLLFGTKKLGNVGSDLGEALKNFKRAMKDEENQPAAAPPPQVKQAEGRVIDSEAHEKDKV